MDRQIERMLEVLEKRDDEHFEGFCQALEATHQHGVVRRYLQKHRVCIGTFNTNVMQSCEFMT